MGSDCRCGGGQTGYDEVSSATVHADCRSALRQHLGTLTGIPTERAWEGASYSPRAGEPFIEDLLSVNDDIPVSLGAIVHEMVYILTLRFPSGKGTSGIERAGGKLLDHFKVGTSLEYGTTKLLCTKAARRGSIRQDGAWASMTVSVSVTAFTKD